MSQNFETSFCYNDKAVVKIMFILPEIHHLGDYALISG